MICVCVCVCFGFVCFVCLGPPCCWKRQQQQLLSIPSLCFSLYIYIYIRLDHEFLTVNPPLTYPLFIFISPHGMVWDIPPCNQCHHDQTRDTHSNRFLSLFFPFFSPNSLVGERHKIYISIFCVIVPYGVFFWEQKQQDLFSFLYGPPSLEIILEFRR